MPPPPPRQLFCLPNFSVRLCLKIILVFDPLSSIAKLEQNLSSLMVKISNLSLFPAFIAQSYPIVLVRVMLLWLKQVFFLPCIYAHNVSMCNNQSIKIAEQNSRVKLLNWCILQKEKRKFPQDALSHKYFPKR